MATVFFDNGTSEELAARLRVVGHNVLTTLRHGRVRAPDDQQLLTAFQLGRIFVTHNEQDFILLHNAWRRWPTALGIDWPPHPGILVVPQSQQLAVNRLANEIDKFVRSGRPIANELYHLTTAGHWQRHR